MQLPASNLADSRIMAVWNLPGANSPDLPALKLLAKCLADGRNAFLETQLTAHGIHADIDESLFVGQLNSQLRISISLRAGDNVAAAEEILNSALSRFIRNGPDAADIRSANSEMSFAMATQRDRLSGPGSATDFSRPRWRGEQIRKKYIERMLPSRPVSRICKACFITGSKVGHYCFW